MSKPSIWPSIDHTMLSPSGKVSKRARRAALAREHSRLFPPGFWDKPECTNTDRAKTLRLSAQNLRELAARGMKPKSYLREADRLEDEANELEGEADGR